MARDRGDRALVRSDDDDDDEDDRATAAIARVVARDARAGAADAMNATLALHECAFAAARSTKGASTARARRLGRALVGAALVSAATGTDDAVGARVRDVATLCGWDANATRGAFRKAHACGWCATREMVLREEAFEFCANAGFVGESWMREVETRHARGCRRARRALGLATRGRRSEDGGGRASADGSDDSEARAKKEAIDGWLFHGSEFANEDDDASGDDDDESASGASDANDDVGASEDWDDDSEDDDDVAEPSFVQVDGAEVRDIERDDEFVMREILSMRGETDAAIAGRIRANVERTQGALDSAESRRARMLQDLLEKFTRMDTSRSSHTGAMVRESSSTNSRHKFFAQREPKTRIESKNKSLKFISVSEHVRKALETEKERKRAVSQF